MPLLVLLTVLLLAPLALADPVDDYRAVHHDWEKDGVITPCYWTQTQLENARTIADDNPDDTYNGFPDRVDEEIARWKRGGCKPRPRIVGVNATRERVRITNEGGSPAPVGGMRLRDRQGHTIKLPRVRIAPRDTLVVRSPARPVWDDSGDIARLVSRSGKVVSQYGYGRYRNTKRF
jgi:hypothetical protein